MNHQDIADRLKALAAEVSPVLKAEMARIEKERQSLCGGFWHIYVDPKGFVYSPDGVVHRECCVCGMVELA